MWRSDSLGRLGYVFVLGFVVLCDSLCFRFLCMRLSFVMKCCVDWIGYDLVRVSRCGIREFSNEKCGWGGVVMYRIWFMSIFVSF